MGCCCSQAPNQPYDANDQKQTTKTIQLSPHMTETYDPGAMSITRDSVMADYQYNKNHTKNFGYRLKAIKSPAFPNGTVKLHTIDSKDDEDMQNIHNSRYIKDKNINELTDINILTQAIPFPHKRAVFISIIQLNTCIDNIPIYILEESLFIFKAQRSWFFPKNLIEQKQSKASIRHRLNFNQQIIEYIDKKDKRGEILWLENGKTWNDISTQLSKLNDIYTHNTAPASTASTACTDIDNNNIESKDMELSAESASATATYKPLLLSEDFWRNDFKNRQNGIQSLYCHACDVILAEINSCALKFNPAMEILYQSNPTLIPMRSFDMEVYINQHYKKNKLKNGSGDVHNINEINQKHNIISPNQSHDYQNSVSVSVSNMNSKLGKIESNKILVANDSLNTNGYNMARKFMPIESNTNTNYNNTEIQIINQYSITNVPSNNSMASAPYNNSNSPPLKLEDKRDLNSNQ